MTTPTRLPLVLSLGSATTLWAMWLSQSGTGGAFDTSSPWPLAVLIGVSIIAITEMSMALSPRNARRFARPASFLGVGAALTVALAQGSGPEIGGAITGATFGGVYLLVRSGAQSAPWRLLPNSGDADKKPTA